MDAMIKLQEQFHPGQLSNYDTVYHKTRRLP